MTPYYPRLPTPPLTSLTSPPSLRRSLLAQAGTFKKALRHSHSFSQHLGVLSLSYPSPFLVQLFKLSIPTVAMSTPNTHSSAPSTLEMALHKVTTGLCVTKPEGSPGIILLDLLGECRHCCHCLLESLSSEAFQDPPPSPGVLPSSSPSEMLVFLRAPS